MTPDKCIAQELPHDSPLRRSGYTHEVRRGRSRVGLHRSQEAAEASVISDHPGVKECSDAADADARYFVSLKPGWFFTSGTMAGCRAGLFQSAERFELANPQKGEAA